MEDTDLLKLETSDLEKEAKSVLKPEDTGSYRCDKLETSELEIEAKNILEHTGLSGPQLELKVKSFSDHHGRKLITCSYKIIMISLIWSEACRALYRRA